MRSNAHPLHLYISYILYMPKAASALLTNIPDDILDFVLDVQTQKKKEKKVKSYGFAQTIYEIIRDYKRCINGEKVK